MIFINFNMSLEKLHNLAVSCTFFSQRDFFACVRIDCFNSSGTLKISKVTEIPNFSLFKTITITCGKRCTNILLLLFQFQKTEILLF